MSSIDTSVSSVAAAEDAALRSSIAIAIMAKQLDAARAQGDAAVQLLQSAANLSKAAGKGERFDAQG